MIIGETIFNDFHQCPFSKVHMFYNTTIIYVDVFKKVTNNELFGKMILGSIMTNLDICKCQFPCYLNSKF